jgi:lactate permease
VIALVGNSASVAFGGMGNPIRALASSAKIGPGDAVAGIGRLLAPIVLLLPFWLYRIAQRRDLATAWPVLLASGSFFAALLLFAPSVAGSSGMDLAAGVAMLAVPFLIRRPNAGQLSFGRIVRAWTPFVLLAAFIVIWSVQPVSKRLDSVSWRRPVLSAHLQVVSVSPISDGRRPEPALLEVPWLATPGTAAFLAALVAIPLSGVGFGVATGILFRLLRELRSAVFALSLLAVMSYVTRYAGIDGAIGVALSKCGVAFPLAAGIIGWLGAVFSGTAAGSNATFGNLQASTAKSLGLSPLLCASAGAVGGAMGKMVSAQSLVVTAAATYQGDEGSILRRTLRHSAILLLFGLVMAALATIITRAG